MWKWLWSIMPLVWMLSNARQVVLLIMNQSESKTPKRQKLRRNVWLSVTYIDCIWKSYCLLSSSDIDECVDGFVECDSKSTCVNLPGWYHCECRDGYHDNGLFSANGESCVGELLAFFLIKSLKFGRSTFWVLIWENPTDMHGLVSDCHSMMNWSLFGFKPL